MSENDVLMKLGEVVGRGADLDQSDVGRWHLAALETKFQLVASCPSRADLTDPQPPSCWAESLAETPGPAGG
jgi:hypothetical protein